MGHDVFISYAAKDKSVADAACATLEARKLRCWIAPRDVLPGLNYAEAIVDAINESRVMVLVFSSQSNTSQQVMREVERAVHRSLPIIPFRIEDTIPSKAMEYFISAPHWLDALSPPLEKHLGRLADTAELLVRGASKEMAPAAAAPSIVSPRVPDRGSRVRVYSISLAVLCAACIALYFVRGSFSSAARATESALLARSESTAPAPASAVDEASHAPHAEPPATSEAIDDTASASSSAPGVAAAPAVLAHDAADAWPTAHDLEPDAAIWCGSWREGNRTSAFILELPPDFSSEKIASAKDAVLRARAACFPEFPRGVALEGRASGKSVAWSGPLLEPGEQALTLATTLDGSVLAGTWTRGARSGSFDARLDAMRADPVRSGSVWTGRMTGRTASRDCVLVLRSLDRRSIGAEIFDLEHGPVPFACGGFVAADQLWMSIDPNAGDLARRTLQLTLQGESLRGRWIDGDDSGDVELDIDREAAPQLAVGLVWKGTYQIDRKTSHVVLKIEKMSGEAFAAMLYFPEESNSPTEVNGRVIADRMLIGSDALGALKSSAAFAGVFAKNGISGRWLPGPSERTMQLSIDPFHAPNLESGSSWKGSIHTTGKQMPALLRVKNRKNASVSAVIEFEGRGVRQAKSLALEGTLVGSTLALAMSAEGTDWDGARVWAEVRPRWIIGKWVTKSSEGDLRFELEP